MKITLTTLLSFTILLSNVYSQTIEYKRIRIYNVNNKLIADLFDKGVFFEHFIQKEPNSIDVEISTENIEVLINNKVQFNILEELKDLHLTKNQGSIFKSNENDTVCGLKNMTYGTMGHFHTYKEILNQLDSMKSKFPDIITIKESIGKTYEGRPIYAVKISDNPDINEGDSEGVVYFDALHHAREPMSMETLLYYMWWLLENYESNPEAKYLIDNRELHFVPIVNPDGYVYNEINRPEGRGYWRKNRRDLGDGVYGVDLNRNYSVGFSDTLGSSDNPKSEVYHGQYAFSESETQAVKNYLLKINTKTAFTCHSYGQMLITSPGCNCTSDSTNTYADFSSEFINNSFNGYGSGNDMVGYTSCGTTSDFMHQLGIFAWTPEIGSTFWPVKSEFCSTVQNMLQPMKYITHLAGSYTRLVNFEIKNNDGVWVDDMVFLDLKLKNKGLGHKAENIEARIYSESDNCIIAKSTDFIDYLNPGETEKLELIVLITPDALPFDTATIRFEIKENDLVTHSEIRKIIIGKTEHLFKDNFENGLTASWENNGWETANQDIHFLNFSAMDSKNSSYSPNESSYILLTTSIDLHDAFQPYIFFNARWSFAPFDGAVLLISSDSFTWDTLEIYENHKHWTQQMIDLSQYKNEIVNLKFQLYSDMYLQSDGIYIEDLKIVDYVAQSEYDSYNKQFIQNGITAYPNPTNGIINIVKRDSFNSKLKIIDLSGRLMYSNCFEGNYHSVDLNNFGKGMYIIIIDNTKNRTIFKVINN